MISNFWRAGLYDPLVARSCEAATKRDTRLAQTRARRAAGGVYYQQDLNRVKRKGKMTSSMITARLLRGCMVFAAMACVPASALASVSYTDTDVDLGSGWRTASVAKTDIDSDGVLGSDGWYVFGGSGSEVLPAYIASLISNSSVYPGNGSYAFIDDPFTTPGGSPSLLQSGTLNPFPNPDPTAIDVSFTFGAGVPAVVQLGLMIDNLDNPGYNPGALQITQAGGGSSAIIDTTGSSFNNQIPDWVFFNILAQPGETYNVVVTAGPFGCACLGAISFDSSPVPEPSSAGLFSAGAGLLAAAAWLRFRRLKSGAREALDARC